jgi:NhaC family Na+:H+ antiporter
VFFALIYGFTGFGIARIKPENADEKQEVPRETA